MDDRRPGQQTFAVVTYLPNELGRFFDALRKKLNPKFANWLPHVTVLPPRVLTDGAVSKMDLLRQFSALLEPFEAEVEAPTTFWPANGVVYFPIAEGSSKFVQLHDALNVASLACAEPYPYVPHITVGQQLDEHGVQDVLEKASRAWRDYRGPHRFRVEWLSLVQQAGENEWLDLSPIPLGHYAGAI